MHIKDQAICIRKVDYSESSQILTLFCRDNGKISAIAKGSRRRKSSFGSPVGIFSVGEIIYLPGGGELATITEFEHLPLFRRMRDSLMAMNAGMLMCELIDLLVDKYDPHPGLYDKFVTFLGDITAGGPNPHNLALLIVFQLNLLGELGTAIPLKHCGNCNSLLVNSPEVYFCGETGGFVCRDCEASFTEKIRLTPQTAMAIANPQNLETIGEKTLWDIEKMLIHHFANTLHKMPKTASYFLSQAF
jgi:DNA repair protein RecO (recombination protein O)